MTTARLKKSLTWSTRIRVGDTVARYADLGPVVWVTRSALVVRLETASGVEVGFLRFALVAVVRPDEEVASR
jgi:hypothetical protein